MTTRTPRPTRHGSKNDPQRRQRIIDATARIIGREGIGAVTFRSVAREAGVPLGSTTYYFTDKDDLLLSTIRSLRQKSDAHFEEILAAYVPEYGVAGGLARMMEEITTDWRESLFEGYGVYLSTFFQQSLRGEVTDWSLESLVSTYCSKQTARPVVFFLEGILTQVTLNQAEITAEEIEPALTRLLTPSDR